MRRLELVAVAEDPEVLRKRQPRVEGLGCACRPALLSCLQGVHAAAADGVPPAAGGNNRKPTAPARHSLHSYPLASFIASTPELPRAQTSEQRNPSLASVVAAGSAG